MFPQCSGIGLGVSRILREMHCPQLDQARMGYHATYDNLSVRSLHKDLQRPQKPKRIPVFKYRDENRLK